MSFFPFERRREFNTLCSPSGRRRLSFEPLEERRLLAVTLFNPESYLTGPSTDAPLDIAVDFLEEHAGDLGLFASSVDNFIVTDQYVSQHTGVTHIYLRQTYNGLEVANGVGEIWNSALWDLNWLLINKDGFDPDLYNGTDGDIIGKLYDSDRTTLLNTVTANDTTYTPGGIAFRAFNSTKFWDTAQIVGTTGLNPGTFDPVEIPETFGLNGEETDPAPPLDPNPYGDPGPSGEVGEPPVPTEVAATGTELLTNGSFETGNLIGWDTTTTGSPFRPWAVSGANVGGGFGMARTSPQDGSRVAWNGFDGSGPMEFGMFQDVTISTGSAATLSWMDRAQWNFTLGGFASIPRTYEVQVRDPGTNSVLDTVFSFSTGTQSTNPTGDTGWQTHTADLSSFAGSTIRLYFVEQIPQLFTGPGQIEFDAISLTVEVTTESAPDVDEYLLDLTGKAGQPIDIAMSHDARGGGGGGGGDIAVFGGTDGTSTTSGSGNVANDLTSLGIFDSVTVLDGSESLPTLQGYDAILVYTNSYGNFATFGDRLADYLDAGGQMVAATFAYQGQPGGTEWGRLETGGYLPFENYSGNYSNSSLGAFDAGHPIMSQPFAVSSVTGYYRDFVDLSSDAQLVASWADGRPFVAVDGGSGVVGITLFPNDYYGNLSGQYMELFGNSLAFAPGGGGGGGAAPTLELLAPDGTTVLATGTPVADNFDLGILDFVVPGDGVYTVRVTSGQAGDYGIVVTDPLVFDTEPNSAPPLRSLDNIDRALGYLVGSGDLDAYTITLQAGESVILRTETPFDDPTDGLNLLDPAIRVLDPVGAEVGFDSNSAGGKNAELGVAASVTGVYRVEVLSDPGSGSGEYLLSIVPNIPPVADANGPYSVPEGGTVVLSGAGSDPDGSIVAYAWDLDGDNNYGEAATDRGNETLQNPTFLAAGLDGPSSHLVKLKVMDNNNAWSSVDTATVNVSNVAPTIVLDPVAPIDENGIATLSGTFTDPGGPPASNDFLLWDLAGVDGMIAGTLPSTKFTGQIAQADVVGTAAGNWAFNNRVPGGGGDDYAIRGTGTLQVNTAGAFSFAISGDDGGRLRIDGNDVIVDNTRHGFSNRFNSFVNLTAGPHAFEWIGFERGGGDAWEFSVNNVSGKFNPVSTPNGWKVVGDPSPHAEIELQGVIDIEAYYTGTQDTHEVTIDWKDGTVETLVVPVGALSFSVAHQYLDDGLNPGTSGSYDYVVEATVTDDDGGVGTDNTTATVNNVAPVIVAYGDYVDGTVIDEGESVTLSTRFIDRGTADTHTVLFDWGDGTSQTVTSYTDDISTKAAGAILAEYWTGIGGNAVSMLTNSPNYPNSPNGMEELTSFESPTNQANNYGARVRGYVYPPDTGNYTFWIASDDNSELRLSTDDDPGNSQLIASVPGWTSSRQWDRYASQQSVSIPLVAGQRYYIEALMKEGGGGDNLAVRWMLPGGTWEDPGDPNQPIPGNRLSPFGALAPGHYTDPVSHTYVDDNPTGTPSDDYTITVTVTDDDGGVSGSSSPGPLSLTQISTTFNSPIGIDYHEPTDSLVVSVNYSNGLPRNFERIEFDGTHVPFSGVSGLTNEVKIATVRSGGIGGFTTGDLFVGNGVDGQIVRITGGGATVINPWVDLPGSGNGLMRGSLYVDRTSVFGGDLIAVTTAGEVWRINSSGIPTKLADVNVHLEGVITVPDDAAKYGPLAGKIITGAEGQGRLYTIDVAGNVEIFNPGVNIEDIDLIPADENFFGVNFGTGKILGAPASSFASMVGDILLTQEFHSGSGLFRLFWDGSTLQAEELALASGSAPVGQWEHVTFAPAGVSEIPPVLGVTVNNVAPSLDDISAPVDPVAVNNSVSISASFTDPGFDTETFTYDVDWGDATIDEDQVPSSVTNGSPGVPTIGTINDTHSYTMPGVYTVRVTLTDDDGGSDQSIYQYIVVYDPDDGFVTGGGWINSPEGAYMADLTLTGKANFGFVSKYKKGATTPTGQTEFQFKAGDLNFHSASYQWLVVAGANAKFKGDGQINGEGNYGFMLTGTDGQYDGGDSEDTFRIKIWDKETDDTVYDNKWDEADDSYEGTQLGGGNIAIHDGGKKLQALGMPSAGTTGATLTQATLAPVVQQAVSYWGGRGLAADRLTTLGRIDVHAAELSGSVLGLASSSNMIWIDRDAAGYGWGGSGMDLLSVVTHELGHKMGFEHSDGYNVMGATLAPGTQRLPSVEFDFFPDTFGWTTSLAPENLFSPWDTTGSSKILGFAVSTPVRTDRVFELMAMDSKGEQSFGGGWKIEEDETDTLVDGGVFDQSMFLIEDMNADSENADGEEIDEDLLDNLALGLI